MRSHAGRDWLFAHAGSLDSPLETNEAAAFEPVGTTDSERVFCHLMSLIAAEGWRRIADFDLDRVLAWLRALDGRGSLCLVWSDGLDLLAYADAQREGQLYLWPRFPPYNGLPFGDADLAVDLFRRGISSQRGLLICSEPLEQQGGGARWEAMAPGELVIAREGIIRLRMGGQASASSRPLFVPPAPTHVEPRTLRVDHQTIYTYAQPVERSMHVLRLTPFTDRLQRLVAHDLRVSVPGRWRDHDDVFGNRCRRILCEQPWQTLALESSALVEVLDTDPLLYRPLRARTRFPLVWMPWQHQALQAFLMPQELPESQLHALTDYAMSFVRRNDADLVDTLLDINWTIFKEYRYVQGTTTMHTSPWETFTDRLGVCQDFTQLFITLARLLGIPARYVCGYLYLGPDATNTAQAAATHAWVQLYLPELGWTGFDPTNGVMTSTDHVRRPSAATPSTPRRRAGRLPRRRGRAAQRRREGAARLTPRASIKKVSRRLAGPCHRWLRCSSATWPDDALLAPRHRRHLVRPARSDFLFTARGWLHGPRPDLDLPQQRPVDRAPIRDAPAGWPRWSGSSGPRISTVRSISSTWPVFVSQSGQSAAGSFRWPAAPPPDPAAGPCARRTSAASSTQAPRAARRRS
ncbi:MAG: class II glutamine amidotransferase [bacterium]